MAENGEIKLLGTAASPFVCRIKFILNLKSIDYDVIEENLTCKSDLLLKSNPIHTKIPVLFHENKPPICESLVIMEYLDEIKPNAYQMLPSCPLTRSDNRFWANFIDTKFFPIMRDLLLTSDKEEKEAIMKQVCETIGVLEEAFQKLSKGKTYFGGDEIGYVDVVLGCFLGTTNMAEEYMNLKVFDEAKTPGLARWAKSMMMHEAIKSVIPENELILKYFIMLIPFLKPAK